MKDIKKILLESMTVAVILALMSSFGGFFSIAERVVWRIILKQILFSFLCFGIGFIGAVKKTKYLSFVQYYLSEGE